MMLKFFKVLIIIFLFNGLCNIHLALARQKPLVAMQQIPPPPWVINLFHSIDQLDTSSHSGFACFTSDIIMQFGQQSVSGIGAVKQFFIKIDSPLKTSHHVIAVWKIRNILFLQGSVNLLSREAKSPRQGKSFLFFNIFWLNQQGKVYYYAVAIPPALQTFLANQGKHQTNG